MKFMVNLVLAILATSLFFQTVVPDLSKVKLDSFNRNISVIHSDETGNKAAIYLDANQGDGLAVFPEIEFENGTIEVDIKGKDEMQRSFVGIAFHIQDENTFNAVYFRPFNFRKPERAGHSVQYISHPEFTWQNLRTNFPEQFENPVNPVPDPESFFHAKIEVNWPNVKVFVDNSETPSLEVKMKSSFKSGKVGFWVGNGSDGTFKNLEMTIN